MALHKVGADCMLQGTTSMSSERVSPAVLAHSTLYKATFLIELAQLLGWA